MLATMEATAQVARPRCDRGQRPSMRCGPRRPTRLDTTDAARIRRRAARRRAMTRALWPCRPGELALTLARRRSSAVPMRPPTGRQARMIEGCITAAADVHRAAAGGAGDPAQRRRRLAGPGQPEHQRTPSISGRCRSTRSGCRMWRRTGTPRRLPPSARCAIISAPMSRPAPGSCARASMKRAAISGRASATTTRTIRDEKTRYLRAVLRQATRLRRWPCVQPLPPVPKMRPPGCGGAGRSPPVRLMGRGTEHAAATAIRAPPGPPATTMAASSCSSSSSALASSATWRG